MCTYRILGFLILSSLEVTGEVFDKHHDLKVALKVALLVHAGNRCALFAAILLPCVTFCSRPTMRSAIQKIIIISL